MRTTQNTNENLRTVTRDIVQESGADRAAQAVQNMYDEGQIDEALARRLMAMVQECADLENFTGTLH